MAGFRTYRNFVESEQAGKNTIFTFRKVPSQTTASGFWFDLSMSPGNPSPQYYAAAPLAAVRMSQSTDGGLNHGTAVSPEKKFLKTFMATTSTGTVVPIPMILCDYLLYYPFIDEGTNDVQPLDNTVTLSRYTDGVGVKIMPVIVAPGSGGAGVTFVCSYTNSAGVVGRTTRPVDITTQIATGTIASSGAATNNLVGPFLPLQEGDLGVRSIESITFTGVTDVGLLTLVLVKPIAQFSLREAGAPVEIEYFRNFSALPEIEDNAYLNLICHPGGTIAAAPIIGTIETIWS